MNINRFFRTVIGTIICIAIMLIFVVMFVSFSGCGVVDQVVHEIQNNKA